MNEIGMRRWNALGELIVAARAQGLLANESTGDRTPVPGGWNMIAPNEHFALLSGVALAAIQGNFAPLVALRDGKTTPQRDLCSRTVDWPFRGSPTLHESFNAFRGGITI